MYAMQGFARMAYWLVRRWTGYRLYHLLVLILLVMATLAGLALPFWWLAEQAGSVAGLAGFALVALAYLYTAMLVLVFWTFAAGGLIVRRLRSLVLASSRSQRPG